MLSSATVADRFAAQGDRALKQKLQELRQTDNFTNFYYLARTYVLMMGVLAAAVWFSVYREAAGWSFWWNVPVFAAAIVLVGALQHHLSNLGHEAAHHVLFKNRYLNDLVSDFFCMFPMFTTTHHYRVQHLAHHQFVNDPLRDPDVSQLRDSGHWDHFPLSRREAWRMLLAQLWLPNLVRFIRVRARYNMVGTAHNPYVKTGWKPTRWLAPLAVAALAGQLLLVKWALGDGNLAAAVAGPVSLWVITTAIFALIPQRCYYQSRIHPTISFRATTILRVTFLTVLINALAWTTHLTGRWAAAYFVVLWLVPIFTSYAFFMVMRQAVQHGNASRAMLTNTRVFFMNRLITFCVFPIGQRYHLPHHLFATVPHYRLRQLHDYLLEYPEYREQAVVVENYFVPRRGPPQRPTVVDVLGPDYAPRDQQVYIDNSVLEQNEVEEKEEILREGEREVQRALA
jgi:fatty acid desaturase